LGFALGHHFDEAAALQRMRSLDSIRPSRGIPPFPIRRAEGYCWEDSAGDLSIRPSREGSDDAKTSACFRLLRTVRICRLIGLESFQLSPLAF
jgi:hypothetical protein